MLVKQITLDKWVPRDYQLPICDALENKGYKRLIIVMPRRSGKDLVAFNLMVRQALQRVGVYYYCLPTFSQARRVIWDNITIDGKRILDFIPEEIIESRNEQQMRIKFINGSMIQLIGSDEYDRSLVGTNPCGIVFSEFALQDPQAWHFSLPILKANNGWALMISTPRGKNHMWDIWNIAQDNPESWFAYKLSLDDTKHISWESVQQDIAEGVISEDLALQEYMCSFEQGQEGAVYAKYLDKMRITGQIGKVPWDPSHKVSTSWDIGMRDDTSVIFFQVIGKSLSIIDFYNQSGAGLEHFVKIINDKPYTYNKHIGPHDIRVREWTAGGITRFEKARQLGINFTIAPSITILDGIEAVRSTFNRMYIDEKNCSYLLKSLENYRREWDSSKNMYKDLPLHNWASHASDAMRYLCITLPKVTANNSSAEELDKRFMEAKYGKPSNLPPGFQDYRGF